MIDFIREEGVKFVRVQTLEIVEHERLPQRRYKVDLANFVANARCIEPLELLESSRATLERRDAWINMRQVTMARSASARARQLGIGAEIYLTGLAREDYRLLVAESLEDIWNLHRASGEAPA